MRNTSKYILRFSIYLLLAVSVIACNKLVEVDEPIDSITAKKMYKNEPQAEGALVGVYYELINGNAEPDNAFLSAFAGEALTYTGGLSADEFSVGAGNQTSYALAVNKLTLMNSNLSSNI